MLRGTFPACEGYRKQTRRFVIWRPEGEVLMGNSKEVGRKTGNFLYLYGEWPVIVYYYPISRNAPEYNNT
jgi:hypothetical protein